MRRELYALAVGAVVAIAAQTFVAIAETWTFGPSLRPLSLVFGSITFPVITAVTLGVPIGFLFFAAARLLRASSAAELLVLVAPFALLQLIGLLSGQLNLYGFFYAAAFIGMAMVGVAFRRRQSWLHAKALAGAAGSGET